MPQPRPWRVGITAAALMVIGISSVAWTRATQPRFDHEGNFSCTFAIRAHNNYSFDVFVDLYDSTVYNYAAVSALFGLKRLKMQNERIPTGKSMDRRYTASGGCSAKRKWDIGVRKGSNGSLQTVTRVTQGSGDRTVDLGPASKW